MFISWGNYEWMGPIGPPSYAVGELMLQITLEGCSYHSLHWPTSPPSECVDLANGCVCHPLTVVIRTKLTDTAPTYLCVTPWACTRVNYIYIWCAHQGALLTLLLHDVIQLTFLDTEAVMGEKPSKLSPSRGPDCPPGPRANTRFAASEDQVLSCCMRVLN